MDDVAEASQESILIQRVLAEDHVAARELYDRHVSQVLRLANRLTRDSVLASECTQDVFVRAFGALSTFRGDSSFATWLHRIALSTISNALRSKRRREARQVSLEDAIPETTATESDPHLARHLERALDGLKEAQRQAFVLYDLEGFTHREIAASLRIPEGTARRHVSEARAALRQTLAAFHDF